VKVKCSCGDSIDLGEVDIVDFYNRAPEDSEILKFLENHLQCAPVAVVKRSKTSINRTYNETIIDMTYMLYKSNTITTSADEAARIGIDLHYYIVDNYLKCRLGTQPLENKPWK